MNQTMQDIKKELGEFTSLETNDRIYSVDRYCHVPGLGTFFFNGSYDEKDLVYSALGFGVPVLVGTEHYYLKQEGEGYGNLYVNRPKEPERKPTVQVGDAVVLLEHIPKIALYQETLEAPFDTAPTAEQVALLQLLSERGKVLRFSYNGYAQVTIDEETRWVKEHELYSYDEALKKMWEVRGSFSEIMEEKNNK